MKYFVYIMFFVLVFIVTNSCVTKEKLKVGSSECVDTFFGYCVGMKDTTRQIKLRDEEGSTQSYDSLCYHIKIKKTGTGKINYIRTENHENRIGKYKGYHLNGKLKTEGYYLLPNHLRVGTWTFYSLNNKVDSIVDYENSRKLTFCEFIQIEEVKNFLNKGAYIRHDGYAWSIIRVEDFVTYTNDIRLSVDDNSKSIKIDTLVGIK